MKMRKLLIKCSLLAALGLSAGVLAAAQSANPNPTPKPTPSTESGTGGENGRDLGAGRNSTGPRRPAARKANRSSSTQVKPPTASDQPATLSAPTTSVKPPTAGEDPTPLAPTPSVKPPTAAKEPAPAKANARPNAPPKEPFTLATVEQMAGQCVALETELGLIEFEVYPEHAPETARHFLNLTASGALDTTTFSRVVKGFVIQGGNLFTSLRWGRELAARANRTIQDEPNQIKHERGVVSMARTDKPHSASTNFFILVGEAKHLDGTFAAFGRVRRGMDIVDKISDAPAPDETPEKPTRINKAKVAPCAAQP
jgi:peptidyl-prolyl cis-trans isomerase B (cyclophilin B)